MHMIEEYLKDFYENAPDMYVSVDAESKKIIYCNNALIKKLGYVNKDEVIGKKIFELYHDDSKELVMHKIFPEFVSKGEVKEDEVILQKKDDSRFYASLNISAIRDETGKIIGSRSVLHDINDIKFNSDYLQSIFETEPEILIATCGNKIDRANKAFFEFTGFKNISEFRQKYNCICDLFEKEDGYLQKETNGKNWLENVMDNPSSIHKAIIKKDGKKHYFKIKANPLKFDEKKRSVVILSNITKEIESKKALKRSEKKYATIFNEANIGIANVALDGTWLDVNQYLCNMIGYTKDELLKLTFQDITHPDDLKKDLPYLKKQQDNKIASYQTEKRYFHKNGSIVWINLSASLVRDEDGDPKYFIATIRDITKIKKAELKTQESEQKFNTLINAAQDAIFIINDEGIVIYCNDVVKKVLGYSKHEIMGCLLHEIIAPQRYYAAFEKGFKKFIKTGRGVLIGQVTEIEAKKRDGSEIPISLSVSSVKINERWHSVGIIRDISERKQYLKEIKKERNIAESYLDIVGVMVIFLDIEGNIQLFNKKACEITGYKAKEVIGKRGFDIFIEDDDFKETDNRLKAKIFEKSINYQKHYGKIKTKTGDIRDIEWNYIVVQDDNGVATGVLSSGKDITEELRSKTRLIDSEERFSTILNAAKDAIFIIDDNGVVVYCNKSVKQILGYSKKEMIGSKLHDLIAPKKFHNDFEKGFKKFKKSGKGPVVGKVLEITAAKKDKQEISVSLSVAAGKQNGKWHALGIVRDISEMKKAEEAMRLNNIMMENMTEGVYLLGAEDLKIKWTNENFRKMFGYDKGEMIGKRVDTLNAPTEMTPSDVRASIMDVLMKRGEWHGEVKNIKKDGTHFWCYANVSLFDHPEYGKIMVSVHTDISERKKAEEDIHYKEEMMLAQSRQAAMGDMIAMIAHQWRQPLTTIGMVANNILLDVALEKAIPNKYLVDEMNIVSDQTQHLSKTIDDFRDFFKPSKSKQVVQAGKVVDDALVIVGKSLLNNNIKVEVENNCKKKIETYPNELMQVFLNIINNSKDVLLDKKIENAFMKIAVNEEEKYIIFSFCDNGGGIPESFIKRIGEPYFTTKQKLGTGLGIYMSKTIVEKHLHGRLTWKNRDNGACFIIRHPLKL